MKDSCTFSRLYLWPYGVKNNCFSVYFTILKSSKDTTPRVAIVIGPFCIGI